MSLHFRIWLIWGLKLTIRNADIGMVEKLAFKTQPQIVTRPPLLHLRPLKNTPQFGVTDSTS